MKFLVSALSILGLLSVVAPAVAQDFPTRPINLIVPYAAGGPIDLVGRVFADAMGKELGQPVLVTNEPMDGGIPGTYLAAQAKPDGYTIVMGSLTTHALTPALFSASPYDPIADFEPISLLVTVPNVLLVNPKLPVYSVTDLLDLLRASPGKYSYATAGEGTSQHISGELLAAMTHVDFVHKPYTGSAPALVDALSGTVPIIIANLPSAAEHMRAGTLRPLAVTTLERDPSFPAIPTVDESGVRGYETKTWNALFAPKGTPAAVIDLLNAAANLSIAQPTLATRLAEAGATSLGSTPQELGDFVAMEIARWAPVLQQAGVKLQ